MSPIYNPEAISDRQQLSKNYFSPGVSLGYRLHFTEAPCTAVDDQHQKNSMASLQMLCLILFQLLKLIFYPACLLLIYVF